MQKERYHKYVYDTHIYELKSLNMYFINSDYVYVHGFVYMSADAYRGQSLLVPIKLELQMVLSCLILTKFKSCARMVFCSKPLSHFSSPRDDF